MVKIKPTKCSAVFIAKESVVLLKTIKKNLALEAKISPLRHHVSVCPNCTGKGELLGDVVAKKVEPEDATEDVADNRRDFEPACEEVTREGMDVELIMAMEIQGEAERPELQVAKPMLVVIDWYNRFKLDLLSYNQDESIQNSTETPEEAVIVREDSSDLETRFERIVELFKRDEDMLK
ncbi:hypothetical protein B9Z19DRAFT_1122873 [Tuber borchii]|uniref:Uncharacterized protein n=1 Tax=Tuber borchii TaxID=42251 RepID=A0A2T6ZZD2_TUBBO|nr:hypothetical protein B9Z19DRAFT_1122873 [Tuber borchii]